MITLVGDVSGIRPLLSSNSSNVVADAEALCRKKYKLYFIATSTGEALGSGGKTGYARPEHEARY